MQNVSLKLRIIRMIFLCFLVVNAFVFFFWHNTSIGYGPVYLVQLLLIAPDSLPVVFPLLKLVLSILFILTILYFCSRLIEQTWKKLESTTKLLDIWSIIYISADAAAVIISMIVGFRPDIYNPDLAVATVYSKEWIPIISVLVDLLFLIGMIFVLFDKNQKDAQEAEKKLYLRKE